MYGFIMQCQACGGGTSMSGCGRICHEQLISCSGHFVWRLKETIRSDRLFTGFYKAWCVWGGGGGRGRGGGGKRGGGEFQSNSV